MMGSTAGDLDGFVVMAAVMELGLGLGLGRIVRCAGGPAMGQALMADKDVGMGYSGFLLEATSFFFGGDMMKRGMALRNGVFLVVLAMFAAGCTRSGNGEAKDQPKELTTNVWSGQVQTIDKARGVEQTLMQSAQRQGQEIDKQGQ